MEIIHLVMTKNLIFNIFSKNKNPTSLMLVGFLCVLRPLAFNAC